MPSYKITLEDVFSFAKHSKVVELTESQLAHVKRTIADKRIVVQRYENGVHWNWVPKKVEEVSK